MIIIQIHTIIISFLFLVFYSFSSSIHAAEKDLAEYDGQGRRQGKISQFLSKPLTKPKQNLQSVDHRPFVSVQPKMSLKSKETSIIDLTKDSQPFKKRPALQPARSTYKPKEAQNAPSQLPMKDPKAPHGLKRELTNAVTTESTSKRPRKIESEMQVSFLNGSHAHILAYSELIAQAEGQIIIASWNVNFIPEKIFSSLLEAKRRGVYISFVVNSVKREKALEYFYDDERDEESETTFNLFKTKSHAKFLFVDSKSLILGSFNALGESYEESDDASCMLQGTVQQLWPFYMSIFETYTSIGEDLGDIFGGIARTSKFKNPGERPLLKRSFNDGSQIFLLRTIKEHEDFFKLAIPHNGKVTIFSPFSTKDNTLKRLKTLQSLLADDTEVHLKVLQQFESGLKRLLAQVPSLKSHTTVDVAASHQKIVILGDHTICVGSLNWLSAAQDVKDHYSNVELSIVLQGPKAEGIIKKYYNL